MAGTTTLWATAQEAHGHWLAETVGICPECGSPTGQCYMICPNHPDYYSPEQEFLDDLRQERMSDSEWRREAEYERFADRWAA